MRSKSLRALDGGPLRRADDGGAAAAARSAASSRRNAAFFAAVALGMDPEEAAVRCRGGDNDVRVAVPGLPPLPGLLPR